jgi:homeobox protein cut-like
MFGLAEIKSLHSTWQELNLDPKRTAWDATALELGSVEEKFAASRKQLALVTKDFRASEASVQLTKIGSVVKAYQTEVDQLTRRAKNAESACIGMYKLLYEVPDPTLVLSAYVSERQRMIDLELQHRATLEKMEGYDKEFSKLKNQEVTVRRLEEENKALSAKIESRVASVVEDVRRKLADDVETQRAEFFQKERTLVAQLTAVRAQLDQARSASLSEQTQLLSEDVSSSSSSIADRDLVDAEVERVRQDLQHAVAVIASLKQDKAELQSQLALAHDRERMPLDPATLGVAADHPEWAEVFALRESLTTAQDSCVALDATSRSLQNQLNQVQRQLAAVVLELFAVLGLW